MGLNFFIPLPGPFSYSTSVFPRRRVFRRRRSRPAARSCRHQRPETAPKTEAKPVPVQDGSTLGGIAGIAVLLSGLALLVMGHWILALVVTLIGLYAAGVIVEWGRERATVKAARKLGADRPG